MIAAQRIGITLKKLALLHIALAIVALAMGDGPTAQAAQAAVTLKIADPVSGSSEIQGKQCEQVTMRVAVEGTEVKNMTGLEFTVRFDKSLIYVPSNGIKQLAQGFAFLANPNHVNGARIAMANATPSGRDKLDIADVTFVLIGEPGRIAELSFTDASSVSSSGNPQTIRPPRVSGSIAIAEAGNVTPAPCIPTPTPIPTQTLTVTSTPSPTSTPVTGSSPPVSSGATPTPQPTSAVAAAATSTPPPPGLAPVPTATPVGTPAPTSTPGPSTAALATSTPLSPAIAATATAAAAPLASGPTVVPTSIPAPSSGASPAGVSTPTPMAPALSTPTAERLAANILTPGPGASPTAAPASEPETEGGVSMGLVIAIVVGVVVVIGAAITLGQLFLRRQGG
jgi:hypothetical protein